MFFLVVLLIAVWGKILAGISSDSPKLFFLDVGQGDAELLTLPGNVKVLTDAGPDRKITQSIKNVLGEDRYIDLAVVSHPQLDHFNGFNHLLENYNFGAFIINGRNAETVGEWPLLLKKIRAKKIPLIVVGAGDAILYRGASIAILSPDALHLQSGELNDTGIVELVKAGPLTALLTADIDSRVETYLADRFDLRADILKVPHHGSKYSSSEAFLSAVKPRIAGIEVGKNRYGHPTPETLARLEAVAESVFRTDRNGTIEVEARGGKLRVYAER